MVELSPYEEFTRDVEHIFPITHKKLICVETLYVADGDVESHYKKTHEKNKGNMKQNRTVLV